MLYRGKKGEGVFCSPICLECLQEGIKYGFPLTIAGNDGAAKFPLKTIEFVYEKCKFGHLRLNEINIKAVLFGFDRGVWSDLTQKISIGRSLHDYTLCGNGQRDVQ